MISRLLAAISKALIGAYPRWMGSQPEARQRIYFANHASHLDTVALWSALPPPLRRTTRPVAARDYWGGGGLKGLIAGPGLNIRIPLIESVAHRVSLRVLQAAIQVDSKSKDNVFVEYRKTVHYSNRTGVRASCPDCHVPKEWGHKVVRKIQASNELLHKALGTTISE